MRNVAVALSWRVTSVIAELQVQQLAGTGAFVTAHRLGRLQCAQARQSEAAHVPSHRCQAATCLAGDAPRLRQRRRLLLGERGLLVVGRLHGPGDHRVVDGQGAVTFLVRVKELLEDPTRLLSSLQIGITLVGVLAGAFGGATLSEKLRVPLATIPAIEPYAGAIAIFIVVSAITADLAARYKQDVPNAGGRRRGK